MIPFTLRAVIQSHLKSYLHMTLIYHFPSLGQWAMQLGNQLLKLIFKQKRVCSKGRAVLLAGMRSEDHSNSVGRIQSPQSSPRELSPRSGLGCHHKIFTLVWDHEKWLKVLTMRPSVASPSNPPKVMTGDMQAQYRNRKEAKHCKLSASR